MPVRDALRGAGAGNVQPMSLEIAAADIALLPVAFVAVGFLAVLVTVPEKPPKGGAAAAACMAGGDF